MRLYKSKLLVGTLMLAVLLLVGCGSSYDNYEESYEMDYASGSTADMAMEGSTEAMEAPMEDGVAKSGANQEALENRKIIENRYIYMETLEFDDTTTEVERLVRQYFGYIEESSVSGVELFENYRYNTRDAYYTLRVPAETFGEFVVDVSNLGNVLNDQVLIKDVTLQYVDIEARIESLEVQEERLLELLEEGANLEDIILLENKLSDVRYEIESNKATINQLDNQISYGTLRLELREVVEVTVIEEEPKTFGEKIASGFTHSLESIGRFFVNFTILLISAIPYLILYGIIIFIIVVIIKKSVRRSKEKKAKKYNNAMYNNHVVNGNPNNPNNDVNNNSNNPGNALNNSPRNDSAGNNTENNNK